MIKAFQSYLLVTNNTGTKWPFLVYKAIVIHNVKTCEKARSEEKSDFWLTQIVCYLV